MTFIELAQTRQSTRNFSDRPVDRAIIDRCIEAARLAPSACNSQPWEFIVVDDPQLRQATAQATYGVLASFNHFTLSAAALVLILAKPANLMARVGGFLRTVPYYLLDIGMAAEHFCLQAAEDGVGTCMLGWLHERTIRKKIGIPARRRIVLAIAMGYPAENQIREKKRKSTAETVSYNGYFQKGTW